MIGTIIKIHSDFYYVKVDNNIIECKAREVLKKSNQGLLVGDKVKLEEYNNSSNQAAITEILPRKNHLERPAIANIDKIIIVMAIHQPEMDFEQLDRYLTYAKINNIPATICINKSDLEDNQETIEKIKSIYVPLGYKILFTSAINQIGIAELKSELTDSKSVLCGFSGVGKSTLLNKINPDFRLKTGEVSSKSTRGTHTTRHVELLDIGVGQIADTPGFSYLKFDNILPIDLKNHFDDISKYANECQFNDCNHLEEVGCNVIKNLENIAETRYKSYKTFMKEAFEYKDKLTYNGNKQEQRIKKIDKASKQVEIIKLGVKAKENSRKKQKQNLNNILNLKDAYYNCEIE